MKFKDYCLVALIAALIAAFVATPVPTLDGRVDHPALERISNLFGVKSVLAQSGYKQWNNIQMVHLGADSSDSASGGTGLQAIQGMAMGFPAQGAANWWWDCQMNYSQATGAVSDGMGISFSNAPTASLSNLLVSVTAATAPLGGVATSITNTSTTQVTPSFTPSATATTYGARMWGYAEMPATTQDTIIQFYTSQATQADVMTLKRDSACMWHSIN